jgi:NADH-quinone oxidoreductase subunit J
VTLDVAAFWGLAVLLIGSALSVVLTKNLFHSVLWLALSLTATAGVFLSLDASSSPRSSSCSTRAGVVTIVVFAIVTTERLSRQPDEPGQPAPRDRARFSPARCSSPCCASPRRLPAPWSAGHRGGRDAGLGSGAHDGVRLPFELLAVLLLVGLLGALYFARPSMSMTSSRPTEVPRRAREDT